MRPEGNINPHLDLNNFPEDYGKHPFEESSTTTAASTEAIRFKKKKNGGKDDGKIYECRFCSLKFCKSQALGGHMNRHRQERETETLNRARQLVFGNEELSGPGDHHLGNFHMGMSSTHGFQPRGGIGDPCLQFRPVYPRLATQTSPNIYSSQTQPLPYPSPYSSRPPPVGEYFMGHVISSSSQRPMNLQNSYENDSNNYTCFGAPLNTSNRFSMEGGLVHAPMTREGGSGNQDYQLDRSFEK